MQWETIDTFKKTSELILVYCSKNGNIYPAFFARDTQYPWSGKWMHCNGSKLDELSIDITHWMPIPAAPK